MQLDVIRSAFSSLFILYRSHLFIGDLLTVSDLLFVIVVYPPALLMVGLLTFYNGQYSWHT